MPLKTTDKLDNYSIVFDNERSESMDQLELARKVSQMLDGGASLTEVCKEFGIPRATVYDLSYLHKTHPVVKQLFIDGKVGWQPLIKSHKIYGRSIIPVIEQISSERTKAGKSPKATLKEISAAIKGASAEIFPCEENDIRTEEVETDTPSVEKLGSIGAPPIPAMPSTKDARQAIHTIMKSLHECASASQLASGLYLPESDALLIKRQLSLLEQWLDDLNPDEAGHQGDPLDQSVGSYIFENMVDEPTSDIEWHQMVAPEDENQDLFYDEHYH